MVSVVLKLVGDVVHIGIGRHQMLLLTALLLFESVVVRLHTVELARRHVNHVARKFVLYRGALSLQCSFAFGSLTQALESGIRLTIWTPFDGRQRFMRVN